MRLSIKGRETIILFFAAAFLAALSAFAIFSATTARTAFAEGEFSPDADFTYNAEKESEYIGVKFDYKITSEEETVFKLCILDASWANYYGYFEFGKTGASENYDGVETASLSDGYIRVKITFSAVNKIVGDRPQKTKVLYICHDITTAGGVLRNINFYLRDDNAENEELGYTDKEKNLGKKYYAGKNSTIYAPHAVLYQKVVFEYRVASVGEEDSFGICLLDDNNADYFGYYYFDSDGIISGYKNDGVTITKLDDGYLRVVMYVPELCRTNQVNNRNHAPKKINSIFLRDIWTKVDVYIRNVSFIEQTTFSMENGASIKLDKPYGIKFRANIPQSLYDEDELYGMAIIPTDYLERYSLSGDYVAKLTQKGVNFKNAYLRVKQDENLDYYVESYLYGLYDEDLTTRYVGIAYKVKDGVYTYADNIEGCIRSIKEVSERAIKDFNGFGCYSYKGQNVLRKLDGCDKDAAESFTVNGFDSNENFKKDDMIPSRNTLALSAAKGESESGEIVLTASSEVDGKTYMITPYDLIHEDGETVLSKENFSFYNACYTYVDSNYRHVVYPKNNQATDLETGYSLVNALVPFATAMNAGETVFDRTLGANQTILVDVYVPYAQKAGKYSGRFIIDVLGVGNKTIDVEFTVYDFALPMQNNANTIYAIPVNLLQDVYGVYSTYDSVLYRELYEFLLDFNVNAGRIPEVTGYGESGWTGYLNRLVDYSSDTRVSTINLYCGYSLVTYTYTYTYQKPKYFLGVQIGTETVTATDTYTDLIVLDEYDRKGSYVNGSGERVVYDSYGLRTILKKIAEYSIENDVDLFKKLVVNCPQIDEPSNAKAYASSILSYNAVRRSIDYVLTSAGINWTGHEDLKASLDDIPFLVTVGPEDNVIEGNKIVDNVKSPSAYIPADEYNARIDIEIDYKTLKDFVALVASFDSSDKPAESSRLNAFLTNKPDHTHVWWYTCCLSVNPYYNMGLNSNRVIIRANRWAQFGMGVEGELYCSVNNWFSFSDTEEITVLTEDEIWQGKSNQAGLIEDCMLVYPNVERYEDAGFKFVATYRLYAVRESVDDYNYLCYAQALIDGIVDGAAKQQAQMLLDAIVKNLYSGVRSVESDADSVRHARAEVVNLILSLL